MTDNPHPNDPTDQLSELVDTDHGQYNVTTEMSTYAIDMDARTLLRLPDTDDASDLRRDGHLVELLAVDFCAVGEPALWTINLDVPGVPYTTRLSTPVVSIRRLTANGRD